MSLFRFSRNLLRFYKRNLQTLSVTDDVLLKYKSNYKSGKTQIKDYSELPLPENVSQLKYIWIDDGKNLRYKTRTLTFQPKSVCQVPVWTFENDQNNASSLSSDSENIYLCPRAMYKDPTGCINSKLILCDTYNLNYRPTKTNNRFSCHELLDQVSRESEPWFGMEQKYYFVDVDGRSFARTPIRNQESANCPNFSVNTQNTILRKISEAHYRACLYAGVNLSGISSNKTMTQWEFQVGPDTGVKVSDDIWMARFLLLQIASEYGIGISFQPNNGIKSEFHVNLSTKQSRNEGGLQVIENWIKKLAIKHNEHLIAYDAHQNNKYTSSIALRNGDVRIPRIVSEFNKGYLEDRRPSSSCDPYKVCEALIRTCLLN